MDIIALPAQLLDDPAFNALQWGDQKFMIALYALFADTERFTIDINHPEHYRQSPGVWLVGRIHRLVKAGMLQITGQQKSSKFGHVRVFSFKYSVSDIEFPRLSSDSAGQPIQASNNLTH